MYTAPVAYTKKTFPRKHDAHSRNLYKFVAQF